MRWPCVRRWYGAIPDLSHTGCGAAHDALVLTVADKGTLRIPSASSRRVKCLAPPYFCTAGNGSNFKDEIPTLGLSLICFSPSRMWHRLRVSTWHWHVEPGRRGRTLEGVIIPQQRSGTKTLWTHWQSFSYFVSISAELSKYILFVLVSLIRIRCAAEKCATS